MRDLRSQIADLGSKLGATALVAALLGGVLSASSSALGATEDEQAPGTRPGMAELALVPATLAVQPGGSARTAITVREYEAMVRRYLWLWDTLLKRDPMPEETGAGTRRKTHRNQSIS